MATAVGHRIARDEIVWAFGPELEPVACDAGVAQACKLAPGFRTIARFSIPKLDATPQPFRASLQSE
jgi:hypothetical protein